LDTIYLDNLAFNSTIRKKEVILFGTIGWPEIIIILVIALLLFGAKRLPEVGKSLGKAIREFKKSFREISEDIEEEEPPKSKSENKD
jgi:sec-independent protein translocase protein TatA